MTDKRLRSLLDDLTSLTPVKGRLEHLQVQARRMYDADIKMFKMIDEIVEDEETREDLKKRFLSCVKRGNFRKFEIAINELKEKKDG